MKEILFAFLLIISGLLYAKEHNVSSDIDRVTVYLKGAQIERSALVSLNKGENVLRFSNLAQHINSNSILTGGEGYTLTAIKLERNYLSKVFQNEEVEKLNLELDKLDDEKTIIQSIKEAFVHEKNMLIANQKVGGNEGVLIEDVEGMGDLYRTRLKEVIFKIKTLEKEERDLDKKRGQIQNQMRQLGKNRNNFTYDIVVKLNSDKARTIEFSLSYFTTAASWTPTYDIKYIANNEPLTIVQKARINQNTGVLWKRVKIKLSTGVPSTDGTAPNLKPWYLSTYQPNLYNYKGRKDKGYINEEYLEEPEAEYGTSAGLDYKSTANYTESKDNVINSEYHISLPYTISSGGEGTNVEIQNHKVETLFKHYAAPRLNKKVYLIAYISEWENLNLLEGSTNIYVKNTLIARSHIKPLAEQDTLTLSLGIDNDVLIERKDDREFQSEGLGKRKVLQNVEITVRNTKNTPINLELDDQIPISNNKDIEVTVKNKGGASYDESIGKLQWKEKIEAGSSLQKKYSYQVKYPKKITIYNL